MPRIVAISCCDETLNLFLVNGWFHHEHSSLIYRPTWRSSNFNGTKGTRCFLRRLFLPAKNTHFYRYAFLARILQSQIKTHLGVRSFFNRYYVGKTSEGSRFLCDMTHSYKLSCKTRETLQTKGAQQPMGWFYSAQVQTVSTLNSELIEFKGKIKFILLSPSKPWVELTPTTLQPLKPDSAVGTLQLSIPAQDVQKRKRIGVLTGAYSVGWAW